TTIQVILFLHQYWVGDFNAIPKEFIIGTSGLVLSILRMNKEVFIDSTFLFTPDPFLKCLIIMVYDSTTNTCTPTVWSLIKSKSQNT
ncbi:hypothetical protein MXB_3018, partial [Myxobolus squamalis]